MQRVYSFIVSVDSYKHHHNQGTQLSCQYKDVYYAVSLQLYLLSTLPPAPNPGNHQCIFNLYNIAILGILYCEILQHVAFYNFSFWHNVFEIHPSWCVYQQFVPFYCCVVLHGGEGNGNPLQYSCLENPMDGGAWQATVHGIAKGQT